MKKRWSLTTLFVFLLVMPIVNAQVGETLRSTLGMVFEILRGIIAPITELDLVSDNFLFIRVALFVFLLFIIPALLNKTGRFEGENKKIATVIGVLVALISSIGMPNAYLEILYGLLTGGTGSIIIGALFILIAWLLYKQEVRSGFGYGIKVGVSLVALTLLSTISAGLQSTSAVAQLILGLTLLTFVIMLIGYIVLVFKSIRGSNVPRSSGEAPPTEGRSSITSEGGRIPAPTLEREARLPESSRDYATEVRASIKQLKEIKRIVEKLRLQSNAFIKFRLLRECEDSMVILENSIKEEMYNKKIADYLKGFKYKEVDAALTKLFGEIQRYETAYNILDRTIKKEKDTYKINRLFETNKQTLHNIGYAIIGTFNQIIKGIDDLTNNLEDYLKRS